MPCRGPDGGICDRQVPPPTPCLARPHLQILTPPICLSNTLNLPDTHMRVFHHLVLGATLALASAATAAAKTVSNAKAKSYPVTPDTLSTSFHRLWLLFVWW